MPLWILGSSTFGAMLAAEIGFSHASPAPSHCAAVWNVEIVRRVRRNRAHPLLPS